MRQTRRKGGAAERGITLVEMVIAMVVVGIVLAATIFFASPLRQAVDVKVRAELTDAADNALQRIGRDVRLALPNSVRVTASGGSFFLEFIPIRTAGRYRAESSGAACGGSGTDELAFDSNAPVDQCFKTIGTIDASAVTANDFLVLNNYGDAYPGQNAYATAGTLNRRRIISVVDEGSPAAREVVSFNSTTALTRDLHDSPAKRFYIVTGNATTGLPEPVTYECTPPFLTRRWGYTMTPSQPTSFSDGSSAVLAGPVAGTTAQLQVTGCSFDYDASGVGAQLGLLTLQLTLSETVSTGVETVTLYHAVHISNVP
jgi:MSHA biogenesis protein MshO